MTVSAAVPWVIPEQSIGDLPESNVHALTAIVSATDAPTVSGAFASFVFFIPTVQTSVSPANQFPMYY